MKNQISLFMFMSFFLYGLPVLGAVEVRVGDSTEQVVDLLGKPQGRAVFGDKELWLYEQGTLDFTYGKVVSSTLLTGEALKAKQQERRQLEEQRRARREALRIQGETEKKRIVADPQYDQRSAQELVGLWNDFMHRYPGIPIDRMRYDAARVKIRNQQEARAAARRKTESVANPDISRVS